MASKQASNDRSTVNGSNTAFYIASSSGTQQAEDDLAQLAEIAMKPSNPIELYTHSRLNSKSLESMRQDNKIKVMEGADFPEQVRNVMPLNLPLGNEPSLISRWVTIANKSFNGDNVVVAHGKLPQKAGYLAKYCGYWANFWPKLFTGTNANIASAEVVMMSKSAFKSVVTDKKIRNAWQIAALAEKEGVATPVNFELQAGDFSFGDGIKAFFGGFSKGIRAIINSFYKTAEINPQTSDWMNINHKGYKRIFGITATALLALMCFISFDYNITWDEPNHNAYSKDVLKYYSSFGDDTTIFDFQKQGHNDYRSNVYYGMSIDVISSAINTLIDAENEFKVRHFLNAITGFLAILFTGLTVRLFSGWLPAILAMLALCCSPSFFGHAFNNPKDIPFAAGYIMAIYYLLRMLKEFPQPGHQTKVMLAISIGFALSIRVGGLLLLAYVAMFGFLHWLMYRSKKAGFTASLKPYLLPFLLVIVFGYLVGIAMWPYVLRQPLTGAIKALNEFEKFAFLNYYELFEGVRLKDKPWYYEPKLIMLTAPLAIIGGFVIGMLLGWLKKGKLQILMMGLLVFATVFPAAYSIYKGSYVYNGWRHFIFIYPTLAAIAVLGWFWLASQFKSRKVVVIVIIVVGVTFVKPGIWSIANHPYQYLYFNEIAGGIKGANGNYELDYWNQTPREAFAWLVKNKPEILKGELKTNSNNIPETLKTFNPEGKNAKTFWTREYEWTNNDWTYAIWTSRTLSKNQILGGYWPPKGTIHEIKVDGVTVAAIVKSDNKYSNLGRKYLSKYNGDSALYFYRKAYDWNPLEEEYARGLATSYLVKMNVDSAILFYKKAIELRDGNYEAYERLGDIYYKQALNKNREKPDKALLDLAYEMSAKAYSLKGNLHEAPINMGLIALHRNEPEKAKDHFNMLLEKIGQDPNIYLGLAKSQLMLNEKDSAYFNLQASIQLNPKNSEPYEILIDELRKEGRHKEAEQILNEYNRQNPPIGGPPMP